MRQETFEACEKLNNLIKTTKDINLGMHLLPDLYYLRTDHKEEITKRFHDNLEKIREEELNLLKADREKL